MAWYFAISSSLSANVFLNYSSYMVMPSAPFAKPIAPPTVSRSELRGSKLALAASSLVSSVTVKAVVDLAL